MGRVIDGGHGIANFVWLLTIVSLAVLPLAACGLQEPAALPEEEQGEGEEASVPAQIEMAITSTAFGDGGTMPTKYTCYGQDISPELSWSGVPRGTQSFSLIVDDPAAATGSLTYWVIFNIPANIIELTEAVPASPELPSGALQGKNDFDRTGYGGACSPWDTTHHYHFVIYALDQTLDLLAGASKAQVLDAMQGHILARAELTATYNR